jgi:hypothetical protein
MSEKHLQLQFNHVCCFARHFGGALKTKSILFSIQTSSIQMDQESPSQLLTFQSFSILLYFRGNIRIHPFPLNLTHIEEESNSGSISVVASGRILKAC